MVRLRPRGKVGVFNKIDPKYLPEVDNREIRRNTFQIRVNPIILMSETLILFVINHSEPCWIHFAAVCIHFEFEPFWTHFDALGRTGTRPRQRRRRPMHNPRVDSPARHASWAHQDAAGRSGANVLQGMPPNSVVGCAYLLPIGVAMPGKQPW